MSTSTVITRSLLASALLAALPACTLDAPVPDLPLAVAPGYEVVYIPKEPRAPSFWDRPEMKLYDEDTYVPPAEGTFEEGQDVDPLFGDPLFGTPSSGEVGGEDDGRP